ncbi:hypothetical protein OSB04_002319 [Centaurea solstitialis]|uniref:Cystatin domain-containing protein n=1 Tax=Centaurea solstitialis TaxID=347529 RepID=A0AA38TSN3_9ASTR|nr:hypothetical protein OSB04_002319 [Centaurea solstitialis]
MTLNSQPLLLVILAFFGAILFCGGVSTTTIRGGNLVNGVGAWDVEEYYLKELGEYAVATHNLESQHQLTFQKVIDCDHLSKLNHKLTIAASEGGVTHTYEAVVCYKPWDQYKELISFKIA